MGGKVIVAAVCWLYITNGEEIKAVNNSFVSDNTSAESVPMLYRATPPFTIYASSSPYGAFSFHTPAYREPPKLASHFVPVVQKHAAFIRDSYGNRFVATPKTMAYRTTLPTQYVKLQSLPKHLSQPLVAAAPGAQFPNAPHIAYGPGIRHTQPKQLQQVIKPTAQSNNQTQPKTYAGNVNTLSAKLKQITNKPVSALQQPTNHKAVYSDLYPYERYVKQNSFFNPKDSYFNSDREKFQKLKERAQQIYAQERKAESNKQNNENKKANYKNQNTEKVNIKNTAKGNHKNSETSDSKQVTVTTIDHEGIKTIVTLDTQPPIPQLNLDWLKPLQFDEPIVPQVQHFLPKIEYDLDEAVEEEKNNPNNYLVDKSKSYENESHDPRPDDVEEEEVDEEDDAQTPKPKSHSKGPPKHGSVGGKKTIVLEYDDEPEISYEINTPTHKESFNQRSIKYDKKSTKDPVSYSYNTKSDKKPVSYSYSSSSKAPPKNEASEYEIIQRNQEPAQIIYNANPKKNHRDDDDDAEDHPRVATKPKYAEQREAVDSREDTSGESHDEPPRKYSEKLEHEDYEEKPSKPSHLLKPEHRVEGDDSYHKSKHPLHIPEEILYGKPKHSETLRLPESDFKPQYQAITPEYEEEDIHLLPTHKLHESIGEYDHKKHKTHKPKSAPLILYQDDDKSSEHDGEPRKMNKKSHRLDYNSDEESDHNPIDYDSTHKHKKENSHPSPIKNIDRPDTEILEKSREVILKDESPEELHSLQEHMRAEMIKEEENNEDDFDKQYKAAAYGFPAYNNQEEDEKEVFDPDTYGEPNYHSNFDAGDAPFERYTQGDKYPRLARLEYKDIADDKKEDYVLDYSLSKPKIISDGFQSKADYYKNFEKHKPENFFKDELKENKSEKLTLAPAFNFETKRPKKHTFGPFKSIPKFNYKSGAPRDSFAFASGPQIKKKTLFVEPQFQYGFEQSSLPQLFDSELSSSASNVQPKTENPITRNN